MGDLFPCSYLHAFFAIHSFRGQSQVHDFSQIFSSKVKILLMLREAASSLFSGPTTKALTPSSLVVTFFLSELCFSSFKKSFEILKQPKTNINKINSQKCWIKGAIFFAKYFKKPAKKKPFLRLPLFARSWLQRLVCIAVVVRTMARAGEISLIRVVIHSYTSHWQQRC